MSADQIIVRPDDSHGLGYCNRGARRWAERYGLDWARFVRDGLPIEMLEATGDAMALRLCAHVRAARAAGDR